MPTETAAESHRTTPAAAPIRASKKLSQDQLTPPLMVDGLEAVRDTHC
ncbi:hypothetical protein [Bradyrhizobium sp. SRS-191]|nr:hypothetical protein [Bradyrhizobium sp. SRS-191]